MATSGFTINGADISATWPDKSYLFDRYPELADTFKQSGLWVSGIGTNGYLGNSALGRISSPVQTTAGGTNWKLISAGFYITSGIKTDGTLWLWGWNAYGQLGNNTVTSASSPIQTVSAGTNWKLVSAGYYHFSAIKTDGTLWSWGQNTKGQLGDNTLVKKSSPVQTIPGGTNWKFVTCGLIHTAAIKADGTLWMWGDDSSGQLGNNLSGFGLAYSSPIQTVASGTNWKSVSCGEYWSAAIKTNGTLWTWGGNANYGQLGDNTSVDKSSPVQTIAGGTNWKQVACGMRHCTAIKTDGTLWLWGFNLYGQLGNNDGTGTPRSSPIQTIAGGTNWQFVNSHINTSTTAIKTDGTLWLWGKNAYGQLGLNDTVPRSSPVQALAGGTNWKSVHAAWGQILRIRDDSTDPI
jgi:alpha-tubulin suppressor-like RCC1 family protein